MFAGPSSAVGLQHSPAPEIVWVVMSTSEWFCHRRTALTHAQQVCVCHKDAHPEQKRDAEALLCCSTRDVTQLGQSASLRWISDTWGRIAYKYFNWRYLPSCLNCNMRVISTSSWLPVIARSDPTHPSHHCRRRVHLFCKICDAGRTHSATCC